MRPTVMPVELREVRKHETVQKILKKQRDGGYNENKENPSSGSNDFLDNLVARQKGQLPQKKAMTQNRLFRPDYMKKKDNSAMKDY